MSAYHDLFFTPSVQAEQARRNGRAFRVRPEPGRMALTEDEAFFIEGRDSFYLATVSETGWPYVQHKGGPAGFVRVLSSDCLAFPDFDGNRQFISAGNIAAGEGRASMILVDYRARLRLKVAGRLRHAVPGDGSGVPEALAAASGLQLGRTLTMDVVGYDWNCPRFIAPREALVQERPDRIEELEGRVRELEGDNARLSMLLQRGVDCD